MNTVEHCTIEDILPIHQQIPEFASDAEKAEEFHDRLDKKDHLILKATVDGNNAGYMVAYDRDNDGSVYCWMAAVIPEYRKLGLLTMMMDMYAEWAQEHGYQKLSIKTRNERREMLAYLVKHGWQFTDVKKREQIKESRILLEKKL